MDRMHEMDSNRKLDGLMASYRQVFPDVDASPQFMPKLWQRIESRRVETVCHVGGWSLQSLALTVVEC